MKLILYLFLLFIITPVIGVSQHIKEYSIEKRESLSIYEDQVMYTKNKSDTIIYETNRIRRGEIEIKNSQGFYCTVIFEPDNIIKIVPYNLFIKTNDALYQYLKKTIFENNEIQNLGFIFYPINRFYDDSILYFNQDIFIQDWDKSAYSSAFKIFSIIQFDQDRIILKGEYFYRNNVLSLVNYFAEDIEGNLVEFYEEKLSKKGKRNDVYSFFYKPLNEKYIIRGSHFRDKDTRVFKSVSTDEYMSDISKSETNTYWYPFPNVTIRDMR